MLSGACGWFMPGSWNYKDTSHASGSGSFTPQLSLELRADYQRRWLTLFVCTNQISWGSRSNAWWFAINPNGRIQRSYLNLILNQFGSNYNQLFIYWRQDGTAPLFKLMNFSFGLHFSYFGMMCQRAGFWFILSTMKMKGRNDLNLTAKRCQNCPT